MVHLWWVQTLKILPIRLEQFRVPLVEYLFDFLVKVILDLTLFASVSVLRKFFHVCPMAVHGYLGMSPHLRAVRSIYIILLVFVLHRIQVVSFHHYD